MRRDGNSARRYSARQDSFGCGARSGGHLHRRWLDLKASITGRDDKPVINEVESGEDYLKEKFETALASDTLDPSGRAAIERAYASVRQGHDRVRDLKHALEGQQG
jgi:uncharacterized protein (TIGR02284 family)